MPPKRLRTSKRYLPLFCAITVAMAQCPLAFADPVNGTFDGKEVNGGTYLNTAGDKTTFVNSAGTGLHVSAGNTVVGREVTAGGELTGNGGHLHFDAPGQVVRIDGNIDVNGVMKNGAFVGNGGTVTVDSAFLYQNGQVFANGVNGGNVNFNVASLTMGPNAAIQAQGVTGAGGKVDVNATGAVDIAKGAIIDTSGQVIGNYNTNVIAIKGGLVNLDGILMANGGAAGAKGGLVELTANGNATALDTDAVSNSGLFSGAEQADLTTRDSALIASNNGNVVTGIDAKISANGADAADGDISEHGGDGGQIKFVSQKDIVNNGSLEVNGGNGGSNTLVAMGDIFIKEENGYSYKQQESKGETGGNGGNAGEMFFVYGSTMTNNGKIDANGGYGGKGGNAAANSPDAEGHYAVGGDGGNGGNGGFIRTYGAEKMTDNSNSISLAGGSGGPGGLGKVDCGCETPGAPGNPGNPGEIVHTTPCAPPPPPPCEEPPPPPPCEEEPPPPERPERPTGEVIIPKNGLLQADRQAPVGQVLTYNRSIFLARPAVPAVARPPAPAARFAQVVPKPDAPPMPAPPEKKKVVRGFW